MISHDLPWQVFAEKLRDSSNGHLSNFFIIVPALTLNFVEHMLAAKDRSSGTRVTATKPP